MAWVNRDRLWKDFQDLKRGDWIEQFMAKSIEQRGLRWVLSAFVRPNLAEFFAYLEDNNIVRPK